MRLILLLVLVCSAWATDAVIGRGCTTAKMIDADCDGYGVGSPLGMDADDNDATVNTPASMLAKYGTLVNFLSTVKGYNPLHIWYVSTTGNDSTCAADDATHPCLTWVGVSGKIGQGDAIVFRGGTWTPNADYANSMQTGAQSGTSSHPNIVMAYPGEKAILDHASGQYAGFWFGSSNSYWIFDGLVIQNTPCTGYDACRWGITLSGAGLGPDGIIIRNNEIRDYYDGIWAASGKSGWIIEGNVIHDNLGEHNIYLAFNVGDTRHQLGVIVRNNILYGAVRDNFHNNGPCDGCTLTGNILYSANLDYTSTGGASNIALQNGWNHGTISNNIVFVSSGSPMEIMDYYDGSGCCDSYDQNYNTIVNNTFIYTGRDSYGHDFGGNGFSAIKALNYNPMDLDLGHNTYQNNIFMLGQANWFSGGIVRYSDVQPTGGLNWLATDIWKNNLIYTVNAAPPLQTGVYSYPDNQYGVARDWTYFAAHAGTFTGNSQVNPLLVAYNPAWYSSPGMYDLRVQAGSPAIGAGLYVGAPTTDIHGIVRANPPTIGAYEQSGVGAITPTITTSSLPAGMVRSTYSQTLTATGDTPITWSITSGTLCTGLSLSGATISGTPTTAQTCSVTVTATNAAGTDSKALSITIGAAPPTARFQGLPMRGVAWK